MYLKIEILFHIPYSIIFMNKYRLIIIITITTLTSTLDTCVFVNSKMPRFCAARILVGAGYDHGPRGRGEREVGASVWKEVFYISVKLNTLTLHKDLISDINRNFFANQGFSPPPSII